MTRPVRYPCAAALLAISADPARADGAWLVEWADHAGWKTMWSGLKSFRTLSCDSEKSTAACELIVVQINDACPLTMSADTYNTGRGDLRVTRPGDAVALETFQPSGGSTKINLRLVRGPGGVKDVEQASGVLVTRDITTSRMVSTPLIAYDLDNDDFPGHADLTTTLSYMHPSPAARASAIRLKVDEAPGKRNLRIG